MKRLSLALGTLGLGLLSGCVSLPDLQLAKQAKNAGDLATAQANFQALAAQGYVDAEIGLADILVRSASVAQQEQGAALYRGALGRSPLAPVRLGKWLASQPQLSVEQRQEAERLLRQGLQEGDRSALLPLVQVQLLDPQKVGSGEIDRELAHWQAQGLGEAQLGMIQLYRVRGDYAQHQMQIRQTCEAWLAQVSECYPELAAIYQQQTDSAALEALLVRLREDYQAGTVVPDRLQAVAKVLADPANGEPAPQTAKELFELIAPVHADAWVSLAELTQSYPDLGGASEIQAYLEQGVAAGSSRAAMTLGQHYMKGQILPGDPLAAEKYLLQALPYEPKAHFFLGKIYSEGQLGDIDPDKALEHLLIAARSGNASADVALAQLFGAGKGIRINAVYAYTFATLAKQQGAPQGQALLERLAPRLQAQDYPQVESLLARELRARGGEQLSIRNSTHPMQGML
ncbi:alginate biosynthesis protein [Pseudomonas sp. R-28-1W-6]|uniref:SEL1-like repeat protein n=1 Tax=Pseudomonas sp. R-28-1W-6 TaxID=2650101 RepID=UPI0013658373|nr:sel1 repeat family protein [Pseudomonas sp. R-28-1W-6]MWV12667.1 alginate biosynthesis protein [Pseudomonas sp. R-28-1W-6]